MRIVAGDAEYAGEGEGEVGAALDQTQVADWDGEQGAAEESPAAAAAAPAADEPATQAGAAEADDDSDDSDDSLDL